MLTEFEVRHKVAEIMLSSGPASRKVRLLLKLARAIKSQARSLLHARAQSAQVQEPNTASHMDRLVRSYRSQYEEVRLVAHRIGRESQNETGSDLAVGLKL